MDLSSLDVSNLSPEDKAILDAAISELEGFIASKDGVELVTTSISEQPNLTYAGRHADCVGKVKHWMRGKIGVVVDFIWTGTEPIADAIMLEAETLCGVTIVTPNGVPTEIHTAELNAGLEDTEPVKPAVVVPSSPPVSTTASTSDAPIAPVQSEFDLGLDHTV